MEWYYGSGIDELVVPKEGELPDRLPSPDSWFKWGMSAPQSFGSGNKYFVMGSDLTQDELNFNGKRSSSDADMGASVHSKHRSSACESFSDSLQPDYGLDDFPGIDDIFLSSLLDDLPITDNFHKSVSISPDSPKPAESYLTRTVDSQNNFSNRNSSESSKYARTDDYSAFGWENREVSPCRSEHQPLKVEHLSVSEENSTSGCVGEETTVEEYVLQDLETVMTQMTDKTRICFRDALYRLAKNSKQHVAADNESGNVYMEEAPPWTETTRPQGNNEVMEPETNTIDRAVANLMFSEMESNVRNILFTAPLDFEQEVVEASGPRSQQDYSDTTLSGDAEVPT